MKQPFTEIIYDGYHIRTFKSNLTEIDLKWHFDEEDRVVLCTEDTDWLFQMDNQLPTKIVRNTPIFIPKGQYHRIIKGTGDLTVKVKKLTENYNFNFGDCDIYAVALHRLYGYPLYVIRGFFLEEPWGGKREWDYEDSHIVVQLPNGLFKDSEGEYTLDELKPLATFANNVKKIKLVKITEDEALSTFSINNREEDVNKVMDLISKNEL